MPPPESPEQKRGTVPLWAYVIASALLWAVYAPLIDWVTGDLVRLGPSIPSGAVTGVVFGLSMYAFEAWLRRRRAR